MTRRTLLVRIAAAVVVAALAALALPHLVEAATFPGVRTDLHRALILGKLALSGGLLALGGAAQSLAGAGLLGLLGLVVVAEGSGRWPAGAKLGVAYGGGHAVGALTLLLVSRARQAVVVSPLQERPFAIVIGVALLALAMSRLPGRGPAWVRSMLTQMGLVGIPAALLLGVVAGVCAAPAAAAYAGDVHFFAERNQSKVLELVLLGSYAIGVTLPAVAIGAGAAAATSNGRARFAVHGAALALLGAAIWCLVLALPGGGELVACDVGAMRVPVAAAVAAVGVGLFVALGASKARAAGVASTAGAAICGLGLFVSGATTTHGECAEPAHSHEELAWAHNDADAAIARGKAEQKPTLLYFHADWCQPCHELEHKTLANPSVREALSRYVLVKVDCTEEWAETTALKQKYSVNALPTLTLVDSSGNASKDPMTGVVPVKVLLKRLEELK